MISVISPERERQSLNIFPAVKILFFLTVLTIPEDVVLKYNIWG